MHVFVNIYVFIFVYIQRGFPQSQMFSSLLFVHRNATRPRGRGVGGPGRDWDSPRRWNGGEEYMGVFIHGVALKMNCL